MKKILILCLLLLVSFSFVTACDVVDVNDNNVTITYDIGEGTWETKPNNKGIKFNSEKQIVIPAVLDDEVEIAIDSYYPRENNTRVFPYKVENGKTYYFSHWKQKGSSDTPFDFEEINKTQTGELTPLHKSVYLEAVYNIYPGITNLQSLAAKYRVTNNIPCLGSPNILVVPLKFNEIAPALSNEKFKSDLDAVFNSTERNKTGFYSVASYFKETSFNNFTPNFVILDPLDVQGKILDITNQPTTLAGMNNSVEADSTSRPEQFFIDKLYESDTFLNATKNLTYNFDIDNNNIFDGIIFVTDGALSTKWYVRTNRLATFDKITTKDLEDHTKTKTLDTIYYTFTSFDSLTKPLLNYPQGVVLPNVNIGDNLNGLVFLLNAVPLIKEIYFQLGLPLFGNFEKGLYNYDLLDILSLGDINTFSKCLLGWVSPNFITSGELKSLPEILLERDTLANSYKPLIIYNSDTKTSFTTFFTKKDYLIIDYFDPSEFYFNKVFADLGVFFNNKGIRISHASPQIDTPSINLETINQLATVLTFSNIPTLAFPGVNIKLLDYLAKNPITENTITGLQNNHRQLIYQLNDTFNLTKTYRWHPETTLLEDTQKIVPDSANLLGFGLKVISLTAEIKIQIL